MKVHVLAEGKSERAFINPWAQRLLKGHSVEVYPHAGKGTLSTDLWARPDPRRRGVLDQLPAKLRAFAEALDPHAEAVLVLIDADDEEPVALRRRLREVAETLSPKVRVAVCIAVEETEAFYLGDLKALARAYPTADLKLARAWDPDSICGTWEYFGRVIGDDGGNKLAWAEAMGPQVTTVAGRSRSPSFRVLCGELVQLVSPPAEPEARPKRWRHLAKTARR